MRRNYIEQTVNKCPHCTSIDIIGYGSAKGSRRFKCKNCNKTFTEYTGTWLANLKRRDVVDKYVELMLQEKSLNKIKSELEINKKTAFDWRHKILSSIENQGNTSCFLGITESDETFFLQSEKGSCDLDRKSRKRGGSAKKHGINNEQVAVVVTCDRNQEIDLTVATLGRITKNNLEKILGSRVDQNTILCTDSHITYKGFALDHNLEHHSLKANLKQHVKDKVYHIQHINSIDSRLKPWVNNHFHGVSTKFLQNYMNWFRLKETTKKSKEVVLEFYTKSIQDSKAWLRFKNIPNRYKSLVNLLPTPD
ncbi:MAG: hypothetical protein A2046_06245 [Bacteroidetes bacterium GWA2_30_7]|nr:MAG: hypothetical protein A2046_06245 [Bacteroidetes bacterium GWA2_30_7]